jgi:hypothetical protein
VSRFRRLIFLVSKPVRIATASSGLRRSTALLAKASDSLGVADTAAKLDFIFSSSFEANFKRISPLLGSDKALALTLMSRIRE